MTNEERDLITRFIERVGGPQVPAPGQGAVAPLPPVDHEADALIADLFTRYPDTRYRITQLAYVSEHALVEAQNRINRLQWELQQARQAQAAPAQQGGSPWGAGAADQQAQPQQPRGFFSSLFGGGGGQPAQPAQRQYAQPQYAQPPQPQYPPGYNPGAFQQQGSGFMGSALRTAAGVAGGVVAADALMSLFSGNHGGGGLGGFGGRADAAEYGAGGGGPWGGTPGGDPYDVGGAAKTEPGTDTFGGPPQVDQSAWTPAPDQNAGTPQPDNAGWQDAPADTSNQDSGWTQASSDDTSFDSGGGGSDYQDT